MDKIRELRNEDNNGNYEDLMTVIDGLNLCPLAHNALVEAIDKYADAIDIEAYIRGAIERPEIAESVDGVVMTRYNVKGD